MDEKANLEVGYGLSKGENAFAVGAEAARQALAGIKEHPISVVQVFASARYDLEELLKGIQEVVGNVPMVGATTAGEICNGVEREAVVVVALASPYLRVKVGVGQGVSKDWQQALIEAIATPEIIPFFSPPDNTIWSILTRQGKSAFALLFSPGTTRTADSRSFDILEVLKRLSQGRLPIMGAGAADDWRLEGNYVFWDGKVFPDSILVAVFETSLKFGISLAHGFRPTGQRAIVTRARGQEVLELDGRPAAEVYSRMLGLSRETLRGKHLTLTTGRPLGLADPYGQYSINAATFFTAKGGVRFTQPVPEGTALTLMDGDHDHLVAAGAEALRKALLRGSINDPGLVLVFSCALRSRILGPRVNEEISGMLDLAPQVPVLGYYSFGEQGLADDGVNRHNNEVIAVLALGRELSYAAEVAMENERLLLEVEHQEVSRLITVKRLEMEVAERQKTEVELRKSEELFNSFMKHLPGAAVIVDAQGRYLFVNETWERMSGKTREEALGKTADDIWRPEIAARFKEADHLAFATKQRQQTVVNHSQENEIQSWLISRFPILDQDGAPRLVGVVGIDISEQKLLKETLRETTDNLQALIQAAPLAIVALDPEGQVTMWNPAAERIFGWAAQEVLGREYPLIPKGNGNECQMIIKRVLNGESFSQLELRRQKKDGSPIDVALSVAPLRDAHGRINGVMALLADISEQKKTEASLQALIQASPLPIYVLDPEGRVQMWNPASERIYGWSEAEAVGQALPFVPERKQDEFRGLLQRSLRGESLAGVEVQRRRKDGKAIDIQVYTAPLYDSQGQITGVMTLNADITESKCSREALRKSEATLKGIFKAAPIGIGVVKNRKLGWANEQFTRMMGYTADELTGQSARIFFDSFEEYARVSRKCAEMMKKGRCNVETQWKGKDGRIIDVLISASAINPTKPDADVIFTAMDITERKQAEEAFKSLVYGAPIGIFITQGGKFKLVNPGFLKLTGYSEDDLLGVDALRYVPDEFKETVRTQAIQMLKGERTAPYEFQIVTKDGETRWVVETVTPTQYEGKKATLGFFLDINERAVLENQLLQAQKMEAVGRLAGGVAHDFNNMLTAIMGYSEMVMMSFREEDPIYVHLEGIRKAADRAATLTRQLLAFSRKQLLQPRVTNLNIVISDLEKMLRRLIGEDIELVINLDPALKTVKADPGQIEQVLMNLVINARDAMPLGGKLVIETANVYLDEAYARQQVDLQPGHYIKVAVIDHGLGMEPETLAHIFEPFFTTKEAGKGTGLGLSTAYGIVKQSGGHIEVSSKIGGGTVFEIYLRQLEEISDEAATQVTLSAPPQGSETVLVVEDEEILLELIKDTLEKHGYQVLTAANGREAVELCKRNPSPIHLMLTDVVMPHKNGRELAEYLGPLHPEMKILYMSGYTEDAMVVRGLVEEALPFLQKPFPPLDLVYKVRDMLDNARN